MRLVTDSAGGSVAGTWQRRGVGGAGSDFCVWVGALGMGHSQGSFNRWVVLRPSARCRELHVGYLLTAPTRPRGSHGCAACPLADTGVRMAQDPSAASPLLVARLALPPTYGHGVVVRLHACGLLPFGHCRGQDDGGGYVLLAARLGPAAHRWAAAGPAAAHAGGGPRVGVDTCRGGHGRAAADGAAAAVQAVGRDAPLRQHVHAHEEGQLRAWISSNA